MVKNMGKVDRVARVMLAAILIILINAKVVTGWLVILLGLLAIVFIATSFLGFCPLYLPFKISTRGKGEK